METTEFTPRHVADESRGAPVRVVDLTKEFESTLAVDGVSFEVEPGEFLSLLGPSGSGKTTILMTIAGFEEPSAGEILVGSHEVTRVPPNKRNIGMVFQKYALFPHMSVFENVAFPLRRRRVPKHEVAERVESALEMVRLEGYGSRKPGQLSGGQQQRVALARATVYRPPLLLMDEPLGALDKKLREEVQLEIKHFQQRLGTTVIYVTHDQDEALTMSDRVAVINDGRLEQIGTPEDLYERPVNSFVADFVGETNFLSGTLAARVGDRCTVEVNSGLSVGASTDVDVQPGARVQVAVRPQRIKVSRPESGEPAGYTGVVAETVYSGDSLAFIIELAGGVRVTARTATDGGQTAWRPGEPVELTWAHEDARVYGERT